MLFDVHLETSTMCNARCFMCPHSEMKRCGDMDFHLYKKVVDDAVSHNVQLITPFVMGEPFMFPDIYKYLDYLKDKPVEINLYTNGSLLNKEHAIKLQKYTPRLHLTISFYGYDRGSYENNMGLDFDDSQNSIKEFMLNNKNIPVVIYMALRPEERIYVPQYINLWDGLNFGEITFVEYGDWAGKRPIVKSKLDYMRENPSAYIRKPCVYVQHHLFVLYDGRVSLCCLDYEGDVILGDMNEQTVSEVLEGNTRQYYLNSHINGLQHELKLCSTCSIGIEDKNG